MKIYEEAPILDSILEGWRVSLGEDFAAYKNHCYRESDGTLLIS